jgi:hypothetical protein
VCFLAVGARPKRPAVRNAAVDAMKICNRSSVYSAQPHSTVLRCRMDWGSVALACTLRMLCMPPTGVFFYEQAQHACQTHQVRGGAQVPCPRDHCLPAAWDGCLHITVHTSSVLIVHATMQVV